MIETHPALKNVVVGTYTYLYDNLEAVFIATWLISLVVLVIVTLQLKLPKNGDWNSKEVLVYEKMMNREGLKSSTIKAVKELINDNEKAKKAEGDLKAIEKEKKKKEPKAVNMEGKDALQISNELTKSKYEKKIDKNLCDNAPNACKSKGKFKDTCTQLECCVWAYDSKKEKKYKKLFKGKDKSEWGECVEGSADDDGPTMTTPNQQWEYYYYKDKVVEEGKDKGKLIKQNINN